MIIVDNVEQGGLDWIKARLFRLTASNFSKVLSAKTGKLSKSQAAMSYIHTLIAGYMIDDEELERVAAESDEWELQKWLSHYTGESFAGNAHTQRGHDYEDEAIAKVTEKFGLDTQPVGMCIMGDNPNGIISCSPDAHVYEGGVVVSGVEVKSPCLKTYLGHVRSGEIPSQYLLQVHGSMAVCDVDSWHFGSHFTGFPVVAQKVERNKLTDAIQESLIEFVSVYEAEYLAVRAAVESLTEKEAA